MLGLLKRLALSLAGAVGFVVGIPSLALAAYVVPPGVGTQPRVNAAETVEVVTTTDPSPWQLAVSVAALVLAVIALGLALLTIRRAGRVRRILG